MTTDPDPYTVAITETNTAGLVFDSSPPRRAKEPSPSPRASHAAMVSPSAPAPGSSSSLLANEGYAAAPEPVVPDRGRTDDAGPDRLPTSALIRILQSRMNLGIGDGSIVEESEEFESPPSYVSRPVRED